MNEESTCYTMIACIENYVTSTYVLQIDENKTITFTSHNPDWPGYPLLEITDNNNSTENMEIYNLDNSGDISLEDVILVLKVLTGSYCDHFEKITLKTPIYLLKSLSIKEAPFIFEPLSNKSEQIISNLNNTYPTINQQIQIITKNNICPIDINKAIDNLNIYLTNDPPEDIQKGLNLILMPEFFQKQIQSQQIEISIDGINSEWSLVPNQVIDIRGDSYNQQQNMDMVEANSLFKADEQNLYVMIAMDDAPLTIQYFSFLIDFSGDNAHEIEIVVFGWEDGNIYCRYNDFIHGLYNRPFHMEVSIDEIFEAKIPLYQFIESQKLKSRISLIPRTIDINLITEDNVPKILLPVSLKNHALMLFMYLLYKNKYIQGDIMTVAMAIADNFIHAISNEKTMRAIERDICKHFDFYEKVTSWQQSEGLNFKLKDTNLIPKIFWADRCGKYFYYVSDVTDFSQLESLTLPVYNEFVDGIDTMYALFDIIKNNDLYDPAINFSIAKIESFVALNHIYRSTMENLTGFNEKWPGSFNQILQDAIIDYQNGGYYTYYFGKTRKWDGFMWLNYQTDLLIKTGNIKGDCGTNTCANMGLYKAAGIPPLSIQRTSLYHFGFTHNYSGYYDILRKRWYSYQKMPRGDVDLQIYFHKYFPHHWFINAEISYTEELTYSSLYQGETVKIIRAENFLSQGIDPDHFESIVVSDKTHIPGFIFNDNTAPLIISDKDKDGLSDSHELDLSTNPNNWDSDSDLLSDTWEILNGYDPNSIDIPENIIIAPDGFVDDITNQNNYFHNTDQLNDSKVDTNIFDISDCYAVISEDKLHVGIQFNNDISESRSVSSELWIYTGIETQVWYWLFCGSQFSGGTYDSSFCSMMKLVQDKWINISTENDIYYTIAKDAEFQIPLKYFDNPDSISIKYGITSGFLKMKYEVQMK
ncbi:MAG: hypothetical protein OMM_11193, partial [Candidatus Magnetoglobus multicellularis str. Araruama]